MSWFYDRYQPVGDAKILTTPDAQLFDRPLHVGIRSSGEKVWVAPWRGPLRPEWFASFEDVVLSPGAVSFRFAPAVSLGNLMHRLRSVGDGSSIPTSVAVALVADIAQQLQGSGLSPPLAHPGAVLVGFDGVARTLRLDAVPMSLHEPPTSLPFEDEYTDDVIGIFPIHEIFGPLQTGDYASDEYVISPEEVDGRPATPASTVYRLGSLLVSLLDSDGDTVAHRSRLERLAALREGSIPLERSVHEQLRTLCERAKSVEPSGRPDLPTFHHELRLFADTPGCVSRWLRSQWPSTYEVLSSYLSESVTATVPPEALPPEDGWIVVGDLEVMRRTVSRGELDATLGLKTPKFRAGGHAVLVSHEQASQYASYIGARLPTSEEWTQVMPHVVRETAPGQPYGKVWEWTSTPRKDGFVVRGGPWRRRDDRERTYEQGISILDHESWEVQPASDVGFRLVRDRNRRTNVIEQAWPSAD